jgi:lysozyme
MLTRKQKRAIRLLLFVVFAFGTTAWGFWAFYQWMTWKKAKSVRYPAFGIIIPSAYSIHGIDVSKYQQTIAWEEVSKMEVMDVKLGFVFIKASEGTDIDDPMFSRNWRKAKEAGMIRGAYHFFIGSRDGATQARHFTNMVTLRPGDLPPVLDVEQLNGASPENLRKEMKEWLKIVESYYSVKPIIYTNPEFYERYLGDDFKDYPLWVAHYYQPDQPRVGRSWTFWQHSDSGHVNGILSRVDFNVFSGDSAAFRGLLIP